MKIVFVCWGQESLAIEYLSAVLKKAGYETELIFDPALFDSFIFNNPLLRKFFDKTNLLIEEIIAAKADLVCFSVVSDIYGWAVKLAQEFKQRCQVPIIFGGIHASSVPEIVINRDCVDYVCVGEGEEALLELVKALDAGQDTTIIPGIWAKRKGSIVANQVREIKNNLDDLPFPDKELFYKKYRGFIKDIYWVSSSRGCVYQCSFCCHSFFKKLYPAGKKFFRERSIENVITELKWAKEKYKIKKVCFVDDLFISGKERIKLFLNRYKDEINLPFACEVHPLQVDEEIVGWLSEAGCATVGMGIQTISEELRKNVLNRGGSNEKIKVVLAAFKKTKIFLFAEIIIGIPGQDEEELLSIVKFFAEHEVDFVLPLWLRYYPRIDIIGIAQDKGILSAEDIKDIENSEEFKPVSIKGNSFSKEIGQLCNMMLLVQFIPKFISQWIILHKLYRYFPANTFTVLRLTSVIVGSIKRIRFGKKRFMYLSLGGNLRAYAYFVVKHLF